MFDINEKMKLERIKTCLIDAFTYSTVRSATIRSLKVGAVYRIAQILILMYIIW